VSRIVVTGATAFIGFHLCEALIAGGDRVVGVDSVIENYLPARKARRSKAASRDLSYSMRVSLPQGLACPVGAAMCEPVEPAEAVAA
jgi:nucleoside-diphosphate-sugar epimerase